MSEAQVSWLPDGRRLHLHHGPIDLIVSAEGSGREAALKAAVERFEGLLEELVEELDVLRKPVEVSPSERAAPDRRMEVKPLPGRAVGGCPAFPSDEASGQCASPVARRMIRAVTPYTAFVTPMAAVAGAVADDILDAMTEHDLTKASVNNGGDIAFYMAPGQTFRAVSPAGPIKVTSEDTVRGLATSGWRGRSHSLGIADAVTVVAQTAAEADVGATLIANAVNLPGHPSIVRTPARDLSPDSDLGEHLVTTDVGALTRHDIDEALDRGARFAHDCLEKGLIQSATLMLKTETRLVTQDQKAMTHA